MSDAEAYRRLTDVEINLARVRDQAAKLADDVGGHAEILHGRGADDPGVVTSLALVRSDLRQVLDSLTWLKRSVAAAIILNLGLVAVALLWRGAFGSGMPDIKDEVKRRPAIYWPSPSPETLRRT